jgi:hypothetical protein
MQPTSKSTATPLRCIGDAPEAVDGSAGGALRGVEGVLGAPCACACTIAPLAPE